MTWNNSATNYDEHLDNMKHELDRYDEILGGIISEIKKDDNINILKLNQIKTAIQNIKGSRKKWASGTSGSFRKFKELNLSFEPQNGFVYITYRISSWKYWVMSFFLNGIRYTFFCARYQTNPPNIVIFDNTGKTSMAGSYNYDFPITYDILKEQPLLLPYDMQSSGYTVDVKVWFVTD